MGSTTLPGAGGDWSYADGALNASPIFVDVDGDGSDEAIVTGGDHQLHAYSYDASTDQPVRHRTYHQSGESRPIQATPVAFDLPHVGKVIAAGATDGRVFLWNADTAELLPGFPATVDIPDGTHPQDWLRNHIYGGLTAADLNADGNPEILAPSINHRLTAIQSDGSILWTFNNDDTILGPPAVGDIDRDGFVDVVFGGDASDNAFYDAGGNVTVLSHLGKRKWVRHVNQVTQSQPVLTDLDADGYLEIVIGTGFNFQNPVPSDTNRVFAFDHRGEPVEGWPYVTDNDPSRLAGVFASPALGDLNNDGDMEVIVADGVGRLHAIRADGSALWVKQAFSEQRLFATPIVADLNADGTQDVIAATATTVYGFSGADGSQIFTYADTTALERYYNSQAVGRFKGDGTYQLAMVGNWTGGGRMLSPSVLRMYDLGSSPDAPDWAMPRRDASGTAVVRDADWLQAFATDVYEDTLGASPSSSQVDQAAAAGRHASTLEPMLEMIVGGEAAREAEIARWYSHFLGRAVDSGGLSFWQGFLESGHDFATAQTFIVASQEAFNRAGGTNADWVDFMYQKLLGRLPSASENASWADRLDNGQLQRSDVSFGFFFSREYTQNQIRSWSTRYAFDADGTPAADTLRAASWDLRRRAGEERILKDLITTEGDYVRVNSEGMWIRRMYQDVLGRAPGATETAGWLSAIEGGMSFKAVARAVIASYEHRAKLVESYYQHYLKRASAHGENANWVDALGRGVKRTDIIHGFVASNEYWNRAGRTLDGFVRQAYRDMLGREASAGDLAFWRDQAQTHNQNVRTKLPGALLKTPEFNRKLLDQWHATYWRRLPSTPDDESALAINGLPYGAADQEQLLLNGQNPEEVQIDMLVDPIYRRHAFFKSIWTGERWKTLD